jgi:putative flippase GtrA
MATPPQATRSVDGDAGAVLRMLGRHQLGAVACTGIDFAVMIGLVQGLDLSPVAAAAIGASCGGLSNFALGRMWIFKRVAGSAPAQAVRYAVVSAASAGWNALGEHVLHDVARFQYVVARVIVAVAVSLFWNFPMQRHFVFQDPTSARD